MTDAQQRKAAKEFAAFWKDKGYEKGESQAFWLSLLRDVYGVEHPEQFVSFEDQVHLDHTSFIDAMIPSTKVMIEQKGLGKDLDMVPCTIKIPLTICCETINKEHSTRTWYRVSLTWYRVSLRFR